MNALYNRSTSLHNWPLMCLSRHLKTDYNRFWSIEHLTSVNSTASTPALTFHSAHVLWSLREDTSLSQSVMCSNSRHALQVFEEVIRCVSTGQRWSLTHISCDMFMRSQANLKSSSNFKSDYIFWMCQMGNYN